MQAHGQAGGHSDAVRNVTHLALWVLAWVATLALASFGPAHLWDSQAVASWAAIVGNVVVGVGLIVAHARYLQNLDKLQRKILLDAMAVTPGQAWWAGALMAPLPIPTSSPATPTSDTSSCLWE